MDVLTRPLDLNQETTEVLEEIRNADEPYSAYGEDPAKLEAELRATTQPLLVGAGLDNLTVMQYLWYVRELSKVFRTRTGRELAFQAELVMRKWLSFGLEPNTMQFIFREIHLRLKAKTVA
ncbi:hypothetical protein FJY69_05985 [candidate division WOR-3 bacterium]|nr:hypothetical protein [candidate division WOR-3 bacterium]